VAGRGQGGHGQNVAASIAGKFSEPFNFSLVNSGILKSFLHGLDSLYVG
jgi:hypothetical protein